MFPFGANHGVIARANPFWHAKRIYSLSHEAQVSTFGYVLRIQSSVFNPAKQDMQQGEWENFPERAPSSHPRLLWKETSVSDQDGQLQPPYLIILPHTDQEPSGRSKKLKTAHSRKASTWQLCSKTVRLQNATLPWEETSDNFVVNITQLWRGWTLGSARLAACDTDSDSTEWQTLVCGRDSIVGVF